MHLHILSIQLLLSFLIYPTFALLHSILLKYLFIIFIKLNLKNLLMVKLLILLVFHTINFGIHLLHAIYF